MTPETLHPCAHRIALTYPFTEHCWPFGPEYDVFKVDGRIFMITMTIRGRALVNLKAEPQKSLLNQQIYRSIEPGYHMNKKHWITVVPGEDISEDLLAELIDDSWHQVVNKLSKKAQQRAAEQDEANRVVHAQPVGAPPRDVAGFRAEPVAQRQQKKEPHQPGAGNIADGAVNHASGQKQRCDMAAAVIQPFAKLP